MEGRICILGTDEKYYLKAHLLFPDLSTVSHNPHQQMEFPYQLYGDRRQRWFSCHHVIYVLISMTKEQAPSINENYEMRLIAWGEASVDLESRFCVVEYTVFNGSVKWIICNKL